MFKQKVLKFCENSHMAKSIRILVCYILVKWTRPARSPADLQVGPETLSPTAATFDDLI
jgi:hypothetical protein